MDRFITTLQQNYLGFAVIYCRLSLRGCERISVSGFGASHRSSERRQIPGLPAASALPLTNKCRRIEFLHSLSAKVAFFVSFAERKTTIANRRILNRAAAEHSFYRYTTLTGFRNVCYTARTFRSPGSRACAPAGRIRLRVLRSGLGAGLRNLRIGS